MALAFVGAVMAWRRRRFFVGKAFLVDLSSAGLNADTGSANRSRYPSVAPVAREDAGRVLVRTRNGDMIESSVGGAVAGGIAGRLIGAITANPVAGLLAGSEVAGLGVRRRESARKGNCEKSEDTRTSVARSARCWNQAAPQSVLFWDRPSDAVPDEVTELIEPASQ